jgi:hypothetical protein
MDTAAYKRFGTGEGLESCSQEGRQRALIQIKPGLLVLVFERAVAH